MTLEKWKEIKRIPSRFGKEDITYRNIKTKHVISIRKLNFVTIIFIYTTHIYGELSGANKVKTFREVNNEEYSDYWKAIKFANNYMRTH